MTLNNEKYSPKRVGGRGDTWIELGNYERFRARDVYTLCRLWHTERAQAH